MNPTVLDLLLVLVLVLYALSGFRRGLFATIVGMAGLLAGVGLCLWFLPSRLDIVPGRFVAARPALLVAALFLCGGLGQLLALRVARPAHRSLHASRARVLDSCLGAVLTAGVAAFVLWFAAGVLRTAAPTSFGATLGKSRVVGVIDRLIPSSSDRILGRVVVALDTYGFPRVFNNLATEPITPVEAADPAVTRTRGIQSAGRSVVRIDALAVACGRSQEGTGFVSSRGFVVTNAHVVAGSEQVSVRSGSRGLPAAVVAFDPIRDIAVLSVPDLVAPALVEGEALAAGDQAVVAGYPLAGPYRVDPARVRGILHAIGDDIYGNSGAQREVYSLRATIHPGNSGGPLLTADGKVVGVVFARSLDDSATAYALTLDELHAVTTRLAPGSRPVGTGACTKA